MTSALAVGWTLTLLNTTYTTIVPERHPGVTLEAAPPGTETRSVTALGERMQHDGHEWEVVRVNLPTEGVQPGKYLIDPASREVAYLVDPGIGGRIREIDGRPITKLDSPKATIMALVTDGILTQKLPWGLVLIGVFLTLAIELMGLQSLPIAVGVYLPISTSSAMFAGGVVRWLVERRARSGERSDRRGRVGAGRPVLERAHRGRRAGRRGHRRRGGGAGAPGRRGAGAGGRLPGPRGRPAVGARRRNAGTTWWRWRPSRCWRRRCTGSRGADAMPTADAISPKIRARIIHGGPRARDSHVRRGGPCHPRPLAPLGGAAGPASAVRGAHAGERHAVRRGGLHDRAAARRPRPAPRRTTGGAQTSVGCW